MGHSTEKSTAAVVANTNDEKRTDSRWSRIGTNFHKSVAAVPVTIEAITPAPLIFYQCRLSSRAGPNDAPRPAHAKETTS